MIKRPLLVALGLLALCTSAVAQVNVVPQVGLITSVLKRNTYSSVALSLPPASSATDIACISGSATKTIAVRRIDISGTATTLITAPFTLVRRATADTGGTPATTTANWANNIAKHDTSDPTATATLISYSANPTINDASPTYLRSRNMTVPTTAAGTSITEIQWQQDDYFSFEKSWVLRGTAQQLCVNLNGNTISTGLLQMYVTWTEE